MRFFDRLKRFGRDLYEGLYSIGDGMASIGEGMASIGYYNIKPKILTDEEAMKKDGEAIRKDFEAVGKDLEDAINGYSAKARKYLEKAIGRINSNQHPQTPSK